MSDSQEPKEPTSRSRRDRELFDTIAVQYCRKDLLPASRMARRLRLELHVPRSRWPARFHAFAAPLALPPDAAEAVTGRAVVGPAPLMRVSERSGKVVLSVREPLLGLRYGIGWE